ncbi:RING finger protein 122 [Brachyhypopomus gauderio]|uniref:RING finger protein 122 n=1 Tax=Brachyhypopomus gauderio TaxID=698409 RepID=UPI004043523E
MIGFKYTMPPIAFQDLFLNIYMVIFGIGISVFILSLIFCCCFISKLQHRAQCETFDYEVVVFRGETNNVNFHEQTCAVCLEDFRIRDELGTLPCQHGFHKRCLMKWLEVRCTCPMCNKPIAGPTGRVGSILDELV